MRISSLAAGPNLLLAWRRITTGANQQYKRLFRDLYVAYEVALDKNLTDLQTRLLGGSYAPRRPERIYLPKNSGLHRPLGVLHLEDQIVLQAFANIAAKKLFAQRKPLQFKTVFSNILEREDSIFFFRRWQETYAAFQDQVRRKYKSGLRWVADFDLAAFYDTVSHELLLKTIYPSATGGEGATWIRKCLLTWSSENARSGHGHGIPQGPIASDFLAECFLLPIDSALRKVSGYMRYVDDVRLFGRTEDDVRAIVIQLERLCREHGLIPQSGKFAIKHATSAHDAMGMLPSIADPHPRATRPASLDVATSRRIFMSSLAGKPYRVRDKTRLRYVLYRGETDGKILRRVVALVPHHPEHADAFFSYMSNFGRRRPILALCVNVVTRSPYAYVRGEAWRVLTHYLRTTGVIGTAIRRGLVKLAIVLAKRRRPENFGETLGACSFLCAAESALGAHYSRFLKFQPPLLQAMAVSELPDAAFASGEAVDRYLRSNCFEPGLAACGRIHSLALSPATFRIQNSSLPSQVRNTMAALGTISVPGGSVDPIAEVLSARYALSSTKSWHALLGAEYVHALGLLRFAEAAFDASRTNWLANQNSFHHAIFIALQKHLTALGHIAAATLVSKTGQLVDFGVMLDVNAPFSKAVPSLASCLRDMNTRRNHLPLAHPYDKKTQQRARHLTAVERNAFVARLRVEYSVFTSMMP